MHSANEHTDTEMTNALLAAPDRRLPQSGAWLIALALGPHSSFAPAGGAAAELGHKVSSQLVPGGAQGEVLELLWHLFPFLGPLVETVRV